MMKIFQFSLYKILILFFLIFFVIACSEYDVASPQWDQDFEDVPIPVITSVSPADVAVAGVNTITITGENFLEVPDTFGVYFNTIPAEVISNSSTSLTVRRPNLVADEATIKVVPSLTLVVAKYSPYKIDPVLESFLTFDINIYSYGIVADANNNIYIITTGNPYNIVKIDTSGVQEILGTCNFAPNRAVIGPDGRLYLTRLNNREILVFDETTDTQASRWTRLPRGVTVSHGIFDSEGYFYAGGDEGGLVSVAPNPDIADPVVNVTGYYENDEILGLTLYQNSLYVAVSITEPDAQHPELAIWRHALTGSGTVGEMELVLDLSSSALTASKTINTFRFDAKGNMFIGIDGNNPLLINFAGTSNTDYFYKSILPSNCRQFCWGTGDYIYIIVDEKSDTSGDSIYRVNVGSSEGS
jgi:hypothetical protein